MCPCKGRQNGFRVFLRPFFEVGKKDIKKGFGKINGLEPLPKAFWAAFPGIFRESGSFCPRQNVEFKQVVLLVLLNRHSECMRHDVGTDKARNIQEDSI